MVGARDVLTLSKWTAAAVPAGHKPRHSTMRPGNAVAPATEVGVVDATPSLTVKQGRARYLSLSRWAIDSTRRGTQDGSSVRSPLACVATNPAAEEAGFWLSERSCGPT